MVWALEILNFRWADDGVTLSVPIDPSGCLPRVCTWCTVALHHRWIVLPSLEKWPDGWRALSRSRPSILDDPLNGDAFQAGFYCFAKEPASIPSGILRVVRMTATLAWRYDLLTVLP